MQKRTLTTLLAIIGISLALLAPKAEALTFELDYEFSGGTAPAGTPPWLTATFTQNGANTVLLNMVATNLTGTEYIDQWLFNFNPLKNATGLTFTKVSGETADVTTTATNQNDIGADGGGYYDILFQFPNPNNGLERFGAGESSLYQIVMEGLVEADFNFLAAPHGGNGEYYSAAHVGSIGPNGLSGWIGDGDSPPPPVPEPSTFLLLGAGLFGLATYGKRRQNS